MGAIYKIGSFNVHNLSLGVNRDIERIAKIIKENCLDIVALQEVLSEGKRITGATDCQNPTVREGMFKRSLKRYLGADWDCCVKRPNDHQRSNYPYPYLGKDKREEGYAFLWDTRRIELPVIDRKTVCPEIVSNYHLREEGLIRLIRDPLVGRFKVKDRNVEIRLITTHIIYGKPTAIPMDSRTLALRRNEFKLLAGDIYARVSDHRRDMKSIDSYTIILGDYNLNLPESGIKKATLSEIMFFDKKGKTTTDPAKMDRAVYTVQHELTTLKADAGHAIGGYANNYDHFSFEERVKSSVFKSCYAIDAVHGSTMRMSSKIYPPVAKQPSSSDSSFEIYLKDVSDHLPIIIELDF